MSDPFILGVNYWPRRKAMYWLSDFDAAEVEDEFAVIQSLGMNVVRLFLLWDDFQPTPDTVSTECLNHLVRVADIAQAHNLQLDVTFFTGHMSGPNWSPGWLLDKSRPKPESVRQLVSGRQIVNHGYRNPYTDGIALNAEKLLLQTVVKTLRDHPAIWMWNLGNEPDLFAEPPNAATGQSWVRDMVGMIRDLDPAHLVTCGLHNASLERDNGLRMDQVFKETDIAVMHSYPMYVDWSKQPLDSDMVPYECAITAALAGKPCLMEEFGGCTTQPGHPSEYWEWTGYGKPIRQFMASEEDFAQYLSEVLPKLVKVGALGAMIWCFADYIPELWDKPPCSESRHERFFGLVRSDGSLKPHAKVIQDFAATIPVVNPNWNILPPMDGDAYYRNPKQTLVRLYNEEFLAKRLSV